MIFSSALIAGKKILGFTLSISPTLTATSKYEKNWLIRDQQVENDGCKGINAMAYLEFF